MAARGRMGTSTGAEEAILAIAALEVKPMVQKSASTTKPNAIDRSHRKKVKWTVLGSWPKAASTADGNLTRGLSVGFVVLR